MVNIMSENKNYYTQIIIAIIGVAGVLGGALFANWEKIFPKNNGTITVEHTQENRDEKKDNLYIIDVYYDLGRKADSISLKGVLERKGFIVNRFKTQDLNKEKDLENSYLYFKSIDQDQMNKIHDIVETLFNEDVLVHLTSKVPDKNIRVVLIDIE